MFYQNLCRTNKAKIYKTIFKEEKTTPYKINKHDSYLITTKSYCFQKSATAYLLIPFVPGVGDNSHRHVTLICP